MELTVDAVVADVSAMAVKNDPELPAESTPLAEAASSTVAPPAPASTSVAAAAPAELVSEVSKLNAEPNVKLGDKFLETADSAAFNVQFGSFDMGLPAMNKGKESAPPGMVVPPGMPGQDASKGKADTTPGPPGIAPGGKPADPSPQYYQNNGMYPMYGGAYAQQPQQQAQQQAGGVPPAAVGASALAAAPGQTGATPPQGFPPQQVPGYPPNANMYAMNPMYANMYAQAQQYGNYGYPPQGFNQGYGRQGQYGQAQYGQAPNMNMGYPGPAGYGDLYNQGTFDPAYGQQAAPGGKPNGQQSQSQSQSQSQQQQQAQSQSQQQQQAQTQQQPGTQPATAMPMAGAQAQQPGAVPQGLPSQPPAGGKGKQQGLDQMSGYGYGAQAYGFPQQAGAAGMQNMPWMQGMQFPGGGMGMAAGGLAPGMQQGAGNSNASGQNRNQGQQNATNGGAYSGNYGRAGNNTTWN
jgi:hypothetical protein